MHGVCAFWSHIFLHVGLYGSVCETELSDLPLEVHAYFTAVWGDSMRVIACIVVGANLRVLRPLYWIGEGMRGVGGVAGKAALTVHAINITSHRQCPEARCLISCIDNVLVCVVYAFFSVSSQPYDVGETRGWPRVLYLPLYASSDPSRTSCRSICWCFSIEIWNCNMTAARSPFTVNISVFWDVALCSLLEINRRFRGSYCLNYQACRRDDSFPLS
jgi:hypothetical protein